MYLLLVAAKQEIYGLDINMIGHLIYREPPWFSADNLTGLMAFALVGALLWLAVWPRIGFTYPTNGSVRFARIAYFGSVLIVSGSAACLSLAIVVGAGVAFLVFDYHPEPPAYLYGPSRPHSNPCHKRASLCLPPADPPKRTSQRRLCHTFPRSLAALAAYAGTRNADRKHQPTLTANREKTRVQCPHGLINAHPHRSRRRRYPPRRPCHRLPRLVNQEEATYPPDSPEGTVQRYIRAVIDEDPETAIALLTEQNTTDCALEELRDRMGYSYSSLDRYRVRLGEVEEIDPETVTVNIGTTYISQPDLFEIPNIAIHRNTNSNSNAPRTASGS